MSRTQFAVVLVVVAVSGFLGGAVSDRLKGRSAYADLAIQEITKPYTPSFGDWAQVDLHATLATSTPSYWVRTGVKQVGDKWRFDIRGFAADTPAGRGWYAEFMPAMEANVASKCLLWTARGYPVSLSDFEINIEKQW